MKNTNALISGCGFHHVAIRTSNWEQSLAFWTQAMGFKVALEWSEAPSRAAMLDTGDGNYLEIFERESPAPAVDDKATQSTLSATDKAASEPNILHFCLRVADCDVALERARAAGAEIISEARDVEIKGRNAQGEFVAPVRLAFVKGPDGEICELMQTAAL